MKNIYYELKVKVSSCQELFSDFILSIFPEAIEEEGDFLIIRSEESLELIEWGVKEFALKLGKSIGENIVVETHISEKNSKDWVMQYQNSIEPVEVGNIYIRPSWKGDKKNFVNVVIDPALAFGSGHHESTYGCLLMLQRYIRLGSGLLDVGCGSGILAISATKLGAITDICDTDEQALESAKSNFKLNDTIYRRAWVGSVMHREGAKYDVVVANIIADVLIAIADELKNALKNNGILILSGILNKYSDRVKNRYSSLYLIDEFKKDEWTTLVYEG